MSFTDEFIATKEKINTALLNSEIIEVVSITIPEKLPTAVVSLKNETASQLTSSGFKKLEIRFDIFIAVDADEVADQILFNLKETFRTNLKKLMPQADIERVEYYNGMLDSTEIRIAKLELK